MAESQLHELLNLLGIERVLVIDDLFTPPAALYTLAFEPGKGPQLEGLPALPSGGNYEEHVRQHWHRVPVEAKLEARRLARGVEGFTDPTGDPTRLQQHVGDRAFRGLTLHEWNAEGQRLLARKNRALILFDVNFVDETGDPNDEMGLGPAGEALREESPHIVGLLTNKAGQQGEDEAAEGWARDAHVRRAELVVVNKLLLADPEDGAAVARAVQQIRTALQASQLNRLRSKVHGSLVTGFDAAAEMIGEGTPRALEDLVFRASREGGEWEGDTWFRLYGSLGLKRAREDVACDVQVRRAIADVRNLLHSRPQTADDESAALAAKVQKAEAYEDADYLNNAGLPIANGDIFRAQSGPMFILVGQPCDLALRPNGRATRPETSTLLPIKQCRLETLSAASAYQLPDGGPLGEGRWEVRFRPEHHVAFDVLDLVSFNREGRATLKPRKGMAVVPLLPGLEARLAAIEAAWSAAEKLLLVIDEFRDDDRVSQAIANELRHKVLRAGGPFKATLSAKPTPFAFGCQRIGRLSGSYADALLTAHAAARSRTAHAHDLTRIVADSPDS